MSVGRLKELVPIRRVTPQVVVLAALGSYGLQLLAVGTVNNIKGSELTTAISLARNIREYTLNTKWANLPGLNNSSHNPPWDSRGTAVNSLTNWEQKITVVTVNPDNIQQDIVDTTPAAVRVSVLVNHNNQKVCDLSWYVFDGRP